MRTIYTPAVIDKATEDKLWESGIIVFDTCALLDFYYMTPDCQRIMADILKYLAERIWLPAHVVYEYKKNRQAAMKKPKTEKYQDKEIQNNHFVADIEKYIKQWDGQYYHPYLKPANISAIRASIDIIKPEIEKIKTIVAMEYQDRRQEIDNIANDDKIEKAIQQLTHGEAFTFAEIKEIIKEGHIRFANHVAPGYKDAEHKSGIRKYGDLILWKEILRYAKMRQKDIIFVTNDVAKGDWAIVDETAVDKKAEKPLKEEVGHPRRELLAEFEEATGHSIWFYKSTDFIQQLETLYKPKETEIDFYGQLGVVRDVLAIAERERNIRVHHADDSMLIRCEACGELFECSVDELCFDWNREVEDEDRGMGAEYLYTSQEICNCPHCDKQIDISLQVWEYPEGVFNMQNIDVEGGELEAAIDLQDYIDLSDYGECERCGAQTSVNSMGLCEACEADYREFMSEED